MVFEKGKAWSLLLPALCIVLIPACGVDTKDPVLSAFSEKVVEISPISEIGLEDKGILAPSVIDKYADRLIIGSLQGSHFVDIFNIKNGAVIQCANKGRGLGEMLDYPKPQVFGEYIYMYDHQSSNYWRIDIEKSLSSGKQEIELVSQLKQTRSKDELYVPIYLDKTSNGAISTGLLGGHKWYCLLDDNFEETSYIGDCEFDNFKDLSDVARNNVHLSSHFSVSPDGSKVVCALQVAAAISISTIDGPNLKEYYRKTYYSCDVQDTPTGPVFNVSNCKVAFRDVCSDEDNIYLLYSGEAYHQEIPCEESSYLFVLDWSGNIKKVFHLTERIRSMCLDGDTLYGVTQYPESKVLVYSI